MLPLLLLLQSPAVPPVPPGGQPAPATVMAEPVALLIAAADRDGDARTTRAELDDALARSFAQVARGGSDIGYLAFADWAERELGSRTALPSPFEVDRDNDNRITLAELQARMASLFDRFDADRDGAVSRAELLTLRGAAPAERGRRGEAEGRPTPPPR